MKPLFNELYLHGNYIVYEVLGDYSKPGFGFGSLIETKRAKQNKIVFGLFFNRTAWYNDALYSRRAIYFDADLSLTNLSIPVLYRLYLDQKKSFYLQGGCNINLIMVGIISGTSSPVNPVGLSGRRESKDSFGAKAPHVEAQLDFGYLINKWILMAGFNYGITKLETDFYSARGNHYVKLGLGYKLSDKK